MALSANTVWEIRTTGSDTLNGGGFVTGASGTDYSQQNAAQYALTGVTTAAANAICLSASASADMIGNICQILSGTNFIVGFYQILSVVAGVSFTLDRTCTTAAGALGAINIGGALASPGQCAALLVTGNAVWQKSGAYTIASTTANVATGKVAIALGVIWQGYNAVRGDDGTAPILQVASAGVTGITIFQNSSVNSTTRNISVDGQSKGTITGLNVAGTCDLITASNCTSNGIGFFGCTLSRAVVTGCTGGVGYSIGNTASLFACIAYANTVAGFNIAASNVFLSNCLSYGNTGGTTDGFIIIQPCTFVNCTAYGNGRDGFRSVGLGAIGDGVLSFNCISENNGGWGFNAGVVNTFTKTFNLAVYNNTAGATNGVIVNSNLITPSGDVFVNAASSNFALNNIAGAGALLRGTGFPGTFNAGATVGYLDVGAAQHPDSGGATTIFVEATSIQITERYGSIGY